jgi:hypothetical protein
MTSAQHREQRDRVRDSLDHEQHPNVYPMRPDASPVMRLCDFQDPNEGDTAPTTVEARGRPETRPGCREHNPESGNVGRAAGAHLTGQRQDGPSGVPAIEQHPRPAHGGSGSSPCSRCVRGTWTDSMGGRWRCAFCRGTGRVPDPGKAA